ncbi:uncharacterized protein LOC110944231 [Helianthus annuus]|uniref:uncharacterized protein LOC110944231 n=1 Tax=Helianthus annuus TaxID=4232 RepID=UPI000B904A7E|nr:uncharacterized protein LOC110944231 [Helianthus annuus]
MTDPDDHLRVFTSAGLVGGWTLPMWCHLFIQTLTGAARLWFDNLPVGKITSWVDLREKFLVHFSQQRRSIRDTADVMNIWRHDDESLEDFITRYNKEVLEIGDVHEHLIRAQFKYAVRCDDMIKTEKNLSTNRPPPSHSRPTDLGPSNGKKFKKSWRDSSSGNYSSEDARATINKLAAQRETKQENRERQWTPLTKTPAEVLLPTTQYCDYHKDNGHTTNNCISLRTEIEKALKSGELTHLLQNVRKEIKQITRGEEGPSKKAKN